MRKDLKNPIDIHPNMVKLSFAKFKKMINKDHPSLDAEEVYVKLGGKLPEKKDK